MPLKRPKLAAPNGQYDKATIKFGLEMTLPYLVLQMKLAYQCIGFVLVLPPMGNAHQNNAGIVPEEQFPFHRKKVDTLNELAFQSNNPKRLSNSLGKRLKLAKGKLPSKVKPTRTFALD
ncbi:MAG: hypothetical protein IPO07_31140 [Haliscomenobacter sp.]|nr:hypothetical protein [Haliscomenobacter sp.]MBK9492734.1 hypothetical protein [Haliscomenobacter sp.]